MKLKIMTICCVKFKTRRNVCALNIYLFNLKKYLTTLAYPLVKKKMVAHNAQTAYAIFLTSELYENRVYLQRLPTVVRLRLCH